MQVSRVDYAEESARNRLEAFKHLVEHRKKQDIDTITVTGDIYSYATKKGVIKRYIFFRTFEEWKNSDFYPKRDERCQGFLFVPLD